LAEAEGWRKLTGKIFVRKVTTRRGRRTYIYLVERMKMLSGKYVEIKKRRLTDEEAKLWTEATGSEPNTGDLASRLGGSPRLRLSPIGYTCKDTGNGFYRVEPTVKKATVLITKDDVNCGTCKEPNCDHVRAVKQAMKSRSRIPSSP
jgi:hypothetical protein